MLHSTFAARHPRPSLLSALRRWPATSLALALLAGCHAGSDGSATDRSGGNAVPPPAPSVTLSVEPTTILPGQSATLTWSTQHATSCRGTNGWNEPLATSGSTTVGPLVTTTEFDLECSGSGGSAGQGVIVTVTAPAPVVQLTASPTTVIAGAGTTLTWSTSNAESCSASGGWSGMEPVQGSRVIASVPATTTYTLTCTGTTAVVAQSVTVTAIPPAPVIALSATPSTVVQGGTSLLQWSTSNATACTASGAWHGAELLSGSQPTAAITTDSTFTLGCTGPGGSASQSTTVSVTPAVPKVSFYGSPSTVASGASATLSWATTDATACTASGAWSGARPVAGTQSTGALTASHTYTLTCTGPGGKATQFVTVTVSQQVPPAPTVNLSVGPSVVTAGGGATLNWSSRNATSCIASGGWSGSEPLAGSQSTGALSATTTYTLTCVGTGGSATQSATVTVHAPAPTISLTATPSTVTSGSAATLTWTTTHATACTASGSDSGSVPTSGVHSTGPLTATATYNLSCTGPGGTAAQTVTVSVTPPPPTVTLSATPSTLASGKAATLTWSSTHATACTASGAWSGALAVQGQQSTGPLTASETYQLSCSGPGGSAAQSVTVTLTSASPTVSLSANPSTVASGGKSTLAWSSTDATACSASGGWSGSEPTSGSFVTAMLSITTSFGLTCVGPGGTASQTLVVTVGNTTGTGTATLSWKPPVSNVDGSVPVTPLAGYEVYYGTSTSALTHVVRIPTAATTSYTVTGLNAGTWYFAVAAVAVDATVSPLSVIGSKTIPQ